MELLQSLENTNEWKSFGKRYLQIEEFIRFAKAAGIYDCTLEELEEYECNRWMFPAARLVMPEMYARSFWAAQVSGKSFEFDDKFLPFHQLNFAMRYPESSLDVLTGCDLRHPIDCAWGVVEGLERPRDKEYLPRESYAVIPDENEREICCLTALHFYHYWQIYELYWVRRIHKGMYKDNVPMPIGEFEGGNGCIVHSLDAISYFQHLCQSRLKPILATVSPDLDGWIELDPSQQTLLEQKAHQDALDSLQIYKLSEADLYTVLKQLMSLHNAYVKSERIRLAEALQKDIWRTVQFIQSAFNIPTDQIAECAGRIGGYTQNYLELLFPDRRKEARCQAIKILRSLAKEYNNKAPTYAMPDNEIDALLNWIETTDLAWFEYVVVELNATHLILHSWHTAASFLYLKSLASFPESLIKTLILLNGDSTTRNNLQNQRNPGMGTVICLMFRNLTPSILGSYQSIGQGYWEAKTVAEFTQNSAHLIPLISAASSDEVYLGVNLALATLVRNFTSHLVVEDPQLLQGRYVKCVRAILAAVFAVWRAARSKGWV